ncbi:methyltransferase [Candidatus Pacearchaeota archaeon]|nr:methyltransferase [Candidatus Pacearchaeota archaeon]
MYQPREDSFLLARQVEKYAKNKKVLDIGTGTSIQAETALKAGAKEVIASDIDINVIKHLKNKGIKFIQSDLFSNIIGNFDLIIFNPPYLPKDKSEDLESRKTTTGGKKGDEILLRFLEQVSSHLERDGVVLLIISSLTPKEKIFSLLKKLSFKYNVLNSKSFFFETLEVWEIKK